MRIRSKISYMAFEKGITIMELFLKTIEKTYSELCDVGYYQNEAEKQNNWWMQIAHVPKSLDGYEKFRGKLETRGKG